MTRADETLMVHGWRADYRACRLTRDGEARNLEPKVMELLFLLAGEPGRVFTNDEIVAALWPDTAVGEDTLARNVFKLRRALDDNSRNPRFIETVPKRGYRLIAETPPHPGLMLKRRADEFYFQATRTDNETAVALYEKALANDPDDAAALAGLANALLQRALRWLGDKPRSTLGEALASGIFETAEGRALLDRAATLSDRAIALQPGNAQALKSRGIVLSAMRRFDEASALYERAVKADPKSWAVLINLADIHGMEGRAEQALDCLERAYRVMTEVYDNETAMVRPWYAALGVMIAGRHRDLGHQEIAAQWYRRVLATSPLHETATAGLASVMTQSGDREGARRICLELVERIGPCEACKPFIEAAR